MTNMTIAEKEEWIKKEEWKEWVEYRSLGGLNSLSEFLAITGGLTERYINDKLEKESNYE